MIDERAFPQALLSVGLARDFVRGSLSSFGEKVTLAAATIVSELATNAVQHARSSFRVRIETRSAEVRIEVSDTSLGRPVSRRPSAADPTGRGLRVVEALAEQWGVQTSEQGKTIWFSLGLDTSGT